MTAQFFSKPYAESSNNKPAQARPLWPWIALAILLAAAFFFDSAVMIYLRPVRKAGYDHILRNTIRLLGMGHIQTIALIILAGTGLLLKRRSLISAGIAALGALVITSVITSTLKVLIHRSRPWNKLPEAASWYDGFQRALHNNQFCSFPSGESACTFAIAAALGAFFPKLRRPLIILAILISAARVLAGDHFPSDVIAGIIIGLLLGRFAAHTVQRG
jgi:undecaprenyl-diphosphatase